jgi:hypothetical protein
MYENKVTQYITSCTLQILSIAFLHPLFMITCWFRVGATVVTQQLFVVYTISFDPVKTKLERHKGLMNGRV